MNAEPEAKKADGLRESNVVQFINKTHLAHSETAYEFEGHHCGDASVSFIVIDAPPVSGPRLHKHPCEEVFMVQEGSVTLPFPEVAGVQGRTPLRAEDAPLCARTGNLGFIFSISAPLSTRSRNRPLLVCDRELIASKDCTILYKQPEEVWRPCSTRPSARPYW